MVASTATSSNLPFEVFNSGNFQAIAGSRYVKLHIYPDESFKLSRVDVESCGTSWTQPILLFINFNQRISTLKNNGTSASATFNSPVLTRSTTFNFGKNQAPCIKKITYYDENSQVVEVSTPKVVRGSVTANSVLNPKHSYHEMNLFDSRFEYAWSTDKKTTGSELKISFDENQTITQIKVWNGYQRSDQHCFQNTRPKTLQISGDDGYSAQITLRDIMGSQNIPLPKPFTGKNLNLTVSDIYPGKNYTDLVISELRFYNGHDWFMINPLSKIQSTHKEFQSKFSSAGLSQILNQGLVSSTGRWKVRLRSNGSFYIQGEKESKDTFDYINALGNYDVVSQDASGLTLKIFGFLRIEKEPIEGDCNGCGKDCNLKNYQNEYLKEKLFSDTVIFKKVGDKYHMSQKTKSKNLPFNLLILNQD